MFKIEQASKYRKTNCFSKYLIGCFKNENTQSRSSLVVKQSYISPAAVSGANKP